MNMKRTRLDDKFSLMALATIVAIVISIGSAMVSVEFDASAPAVAQAKDAQAKLPARVTAQTVAIATVTTAVR